MMNPPSIFITPAHAPLESPVSLQIGIKTRRSFCARPLRNRSKGAPPGSFLSQQLSADLPSGSLRRSRSASPSSTRRKEITGPPVLKRKYLRQVKLPPMPQLSFSKARKNATSEAPIISVPSTFEQELAHQDNQSPNDPEFVRRASDRWRRTGAGQLQPPLHLLPQGSVHLQPAFQWPSVPSQQSAFQRRVSPRPIHYLQSPFSTVPTSPTLGASPFMRCSTQYSSLNINTKESNFKRNSRAYSSFGSVSRSRVHLWASDHSPSKLLMHAARSVSPSSRSAEGTHALPARHALEDTVVEEDKKVAKKERFLANPDEASLTKPFRRLSARIRKSFRGSKKSSSCNNSSSDTKKICDDSISISSSSSYCSNDNTPMDSSSFTSSTSYQSFLSSSSGYSSDCSTSPSSPAPPSSPAIVPRRISLPPIPNPAMAVSILTGRFTFQDIFLDEQQIADRLAIMFPTEPRPEWHRHLRQVINKAGQRIFKKDEPHETTIPENLRHQLKHIYVY